ncbi:cytochrome P450 [Xylariales sp. AK1849]|nr:cytochrome P450 [Xylariales sp. AK1849]
MYTMSTFTVLSALAVAAAFQFFYRLYQTRRRFNGLPGPPHSFLWGHLKVMGEIAAQFPPNMHPQSYITTIAQKYDLKGVFYLDLWPITYPQVVLTEPDLMDQVQVTRNYDQHEQAEDTLRPLVGSNRLHNAMAPSFQMSHVRTLTGLMAGETLFHDKLKTPAASGETKGSSYLDDLKEIQELVNESLGINPFVKVKMFLKKFAVSRRIDASITAKIHERLARLRDEKVVPSRKDFLSILDLMLRETLLRDGTVKGAHLPQGKVDLLVTNVKGLLLGGQGTTVDTLCCIYMLLSKHPEVVRKLREEHDTVFGRDLSETLENLENSPSKLNDLEYTSSVIKEGLRLFPVGFGIRRAPAGATVNYQDRDYPIDDLVVVPCWHTMQFNPAYYPSPSELRPERFFNDAPGGSCMPRTKLGLDDMRLVLLLTIRDFDFHCAGLEPNAKPRTTYTDLDTIYGDIIFQELALWARPRGGMMMIVTESGYGKP